MTFQTAVFAVDNNTMSSNFLRLMQQSATLGSQGVVGHLDCQVNANSPNTSGVYITSGAVIVLGVETSYQGSYYGYNVGSDTTLTIGSTGGSSRSDMVVVRAEDPTWSGSGWGGPPSGQILYPRVLANVGAGATTPPGGFSCIPLARIDMPASTSVVQQSYIHDLRQVCNPQRILAVVAAQGTGTGTAQPTSTTPAQWPPGASWQVNIPSFTTTMVLSWTLSGMLCTDSRTIGFYTYPVIGSSVTSPLVSTPQSYFFSNVNASGGAIYGLSGGGSVSIGPSLRGTTQTLQFATAGDGSGTGLVQWWKGSVATVTMEFQQLPALA